jgi:hypothetical protein
MLWMVVFEPLVVNMLQDEERERLEQLKPRTTASFNAGCYTHQRAAAPTSSHKAASLLTSHLVGVRQLRRLGLPALTALSATSTGLPTRPTPASAHHVLAMESQTGEVAEKVIRRVELGQASAPVDLSHLFCTAWHRLNPALHRSFPVLLHLARLTHPGGA